MILRLRYYKLSVVGVSLIVDYIYGLVFYFGYYIEGNGDFFGGNIIFFGLYDFFI